jgi:hypothetical protein
MVDGMMNKISEINLKGKLKGDLWEIITQNDDFEYFPHLYESAISNRDLIFMVASLACCIGMSLTDRLFKKHLPQSVIDGYVGAFKYVRQNSDPMEFVLAVFVTGYMFIDEAFDIMDFDGFERRFKTNYEEHKLWGDKFAQQLKTHYNFLYENEIVIEDIYSNYLYYHYARVIMSTYKTGFRLHSRISGGLAADGGLTGDFDPDKIDYWFLPEHVRENLSQKTFEESWHKPIFDLHLQKPRSYENFKTEEEYLKVASTNINNYKSFMQQIWEKRWLQVFLGFETKWSPNRREYIIRSMGHYDYFEDFIEMCDCMDLRYVGELWAEEYALRHLWNMNTPSEEDEHKFDVVHPGVEDENLIDRQYLNMTRKYADMIWGPKWSHGTPGFHNGNRWDAGIFRDIEMTQAIGFLPKYHHTFYTYVYDEALDCGLFQFDEDIDEGRQITRAERRSEAIEAIYRNIEELDLFVNSYRIGDFDRLYRRAMLSNKDSARAIINNEKITAAHYEQLRESLYMTENNNYLSTNIVNDYNFDSATPYQLGFQDPATPIMEGIIDLHHDLAFFHGIGKCFCNMDVRSNRLFFSDKR